MTEHDALEKKSLRLVETGKKGWDILAKACVCFANGRGGTFVLGIEDDHTEPPEGQTIAPHLADRVFTRIGELTLNVTPAYPEVHTADNGGQYLTISVPSSRTLACTRDGRYVARLGDTCKPVQPEDMARLAAEKGALVWELQLTETPVAAAEPRHIRRLLDGLRASDRVKDAIKARTDDEILAGYDLVEDGRLTHLGVLWLGRREARVRLRHAPVIQYIRYGPDGRKVDKEMFGDDSEASPWDLVDGVRGLSVWREAIEVPEGVFRNRVPIYDAEVVRELVVNALAHRVYTTTGDIFVSVHADRLEVHSPGPLPVGVTPANILHAKKRRNESLVRLFHDLKLMEGEGTGYDRMYDLLLSSGRPAPEVAEGPDRVEVTVRGLDLDRRALRVVAAAGSDLRDRERIVLGLLARSGPQTRSELASALSLASAHQVRAWEGNLEARGLVIVRGRAAGQRLKVNPKLLRQSGVALKTTLVDIENHRLRELLRTDIEDFPGSRISEISGRVGSEIPRRRLQRQLAKLRDEGVVEMRGTRGEARYYPSP